MRARRFWTPRKLAVVHAGTRRESVGQPGTSRAPRSLRSSSGGGGEGGPGGRQGTSAGRGAAESRGSCAPPRLAPMKNSPSAITSAVAFFIAAARNFLIRRLYPVSFSTRTGGHVPPEADKGRRARVRCIFVLDTVSSASPLSQPSLVSYHRVFFSLVSSRDFRASRNFPASSSPSRQRKTLLSLARVPSL